jgi:hypothetical protein
MTEHLSECPVERMLRRGKTVGSQTCICDALRACEERVRLQAIGSNTQRILIEHGEDCWRGGYAKALRESWEAVAALPKGGMGQRAHELWRNALAAIDALREEKP